MRIVVISIAMSTVIVAVAARAHDGGEDMEHRRSIPDPHLHIEAISDLGDIGVVIDAGSYQGSFQDDRLLGSFAAWRHGAWRPVEWRGCGTGLEETTFPPGRYRASPMAPIHRAIMGPGRYRFDVVLEAEDGSLRSTSRVFEIARMSSNELNVLVTEIATEAPAHCTFSNDVASIVLERAAPDELMRLLEMDALRLHVRSAFARIALDNEDFRELVTSAVTDKTREVSLVSAIALGMEGRPAMAPAVFDRLADGLVHREGDLDLLDALATMAPSYMPAWPKPLEPEILAQLEATTDPQLAFALGRVLQERPELNDALRARAAVRVAALASGFTPSSPEGEALRELEHALVVGKDAYIGRDFLLRANHCLEACTVSAEAHQVIAHLRSASPVVDLGPLDVP